MVSVPPTGDHVAVKRVDITYPPPYKQWGFPVALDNRLSIGEMEGVYDPRG
jgi:hypothetical protein